MSNTRILVVEDQSAMRRLISYNLGKAGYEIVEAVNGEEPLRAFSEINIDLIVSDIMMPVIDGIELCRKVRENPDHQAIPLIFLTARGQQADKIDGFRAGADDYITKPFDPAKLHEAITRNLQKDKRKT